MNQRDGAAESSTIPMNWLSAMRLDNRLALTTTIVVLLMLTLSGCGSSSLPASAVVPGSQVASNKSGWIGAWGAAPYGPYPLGPLSTPVSGAPSIPIALPIPSYFPNNEAVDQSFRMIVHPTIGGTTVRVRLSNLMGTQPITFSPVRIGTSVLETGPTLVPNTNTQLLFGGQPGVTIAPGAEAVSDPASFGFNFGDSLAISFHVVGESGPMTWHAISFGPNYVGLPSGGDTTDDVTGTSFPQPSLGWFFISGIDVLAPESPGTIVAIGDSITDGAYTVLNTRWTDFLAQTIQSSDDDMGLLNEGINSNTVTVAGSPPGDEYEGPPAVLRFQRDVLQRPGLRSVIIFEGTNDLSAGVSAADVFAGLRSMVERAHAAGLCVVAGTVMPRGNTPIAPWSSANEVQREALNVMIKAQTDLEGLADFDKAMADPLDPTAPFLPYYFVDQLHPNDVGSVVMAGAVPTQALVPSSGGPCVGR
jgi:lysophospholipase L1-like esterase